MLPSVRNIRAAAGTAAPLTHAAYGKYKRYLKYSEILR